MSQIRRRNFLVAASALLVLPLAEAQQTGKVHRIGFLGATSGSSYGSRIAMLRAGLRDLGYVEGKNIEFELRWAEGKYERLPEMAAELVRLKVDVIVTHGPSGALAAKRATTTIPIVMAIIADPLVTGVVTSLARPGGNITGSTFLNTELAAKRLEILREVLPRVRKIAVLHNPDNPAFRPILQAMEVTAKPLKLQLEPVQVRASDELESAFGTMVAKRVDAVMIIDDAVLVVNAKAIADLALNKRLPSIGGQADFSEAGGLMAYGVDQLQMWRRAGAYIDKIFKGAKPGDLPIERATKFELAINITTAKTLDIKLPQSILLRADKVIE